MLAAVLVLAACGGSDDGADVRTVGGTDADASASGNAASASGPASGSLADVACEPVGDLDDADTVVATTLDEWSISPETQEVAAGAVGFDVTNAGEEPHELVVVRAASVGDLPTDEDGAFDEDAVEEGAVIGEIEAFPAGEDCSGVFDLEPAEYVLLCNLVEQEDGEVESHFDLGMHIEFDVTE